MESSRRLLSSLPQFITTVSSVLRVIEGIDSFSFCRGNEDEKYFSVQASRKGVLRDSTGTLFGLWAPRKEKGMQIPLKIVCKISSKNMFYPCLQQVTKLRLQLNSLQVCQYIILLLFLVTSQILLFVYLLVASKILLFACPLL